MSASAPDDTRGLKRIKTEATADSETTNKPVETTAAAAAMPLHEDVQHRANIKTEDTTDSSVDINSMRTIAMRATPNKNFRGLEDPETGSINLNGTIIDAAPVVAAISPIMGQQVLTEDTSAVKAEVNEINDDVSTTRSAELNNPGSQEKISSPVPTAATIASSADTPVDGLHAAEVTTPLKEENDTNLPDDKNERAVLPKASSIGLEDRELPKTVEEINDLELFKQGKKIITWDKVIVNLVVQLKKKNPEKPLSAEQMQTVCDILKMISQLEVIKPERKGIINYVLAAIMGETPRVTEPYSFPDPFPAWANIVKDRVAELMLHEVPLDDVTTPTLPAAPLVDSKKRKRSTPNASHSGQHSTLDINDPEVRKAMYNITRGGGSERKTIKIADPSKTLDYNVWGNNGLQIGAWYPYRLNALQAGAHGSAQGGIAGGAQEGAKSIVVGGGYHEEDKDKGDIIYFSGTTSYSDASAAVTNENKGVAQVTHSTKAMQLSMKNMRPIRVLRAANGTSRFAPSCGFRYDGLYKIVEQKEKVNKKGGKYVEFKLARMENQAPIDLSRPTLREKQVFQTLKEAV